MKKLSVLLMCILIASLPTFAKCKSCKVEQTNINCTRAYAEQLKKDRATISNALQLSEEQSKQRMELIVSTNKILEEKFSALDDANLKLRILKSDNANKDAIKAQEQAIKQIKKDIETIIENEHKTFRKTLNHEQRVKLRMIQKLQRKAVRSAKHPKNYYKSNPKLREFAPHIKVD